jgi:predicted dehydrogenase
MTQISVIGKSGHASRHISLIQQLDSARLKNVLYYKQVDDNDLPYTQDIQDLMSSDGIIISSPTDTHLDYLQKLSSFPGFVLLEKPGFSTLEELETISLFSDERKSRIRINYNFKYSPLLIKIQNLLNSKKLGTPLSVTIQTGHGLAYKESYQNDWRNNLERSAGVAELVGSHYLNFVTAFFGQITSHHCYFRWMAPHQDQSPADHVNLNSHHQGGVISNLTHSYSSPYQNKIDITFSDGLIQYDGKMLRVYHPRDHFDKDGRFAPPQIIEEVEFPFASNWKEGLKNSVSSFVQESKNKEFYPPENLNFDLNSFLPILGAKEKMKNTNA